MSLAARWISSPLPYQLGLALHMAESSAGVRDRQLLSDPQRGSTLDSHFRPSSLLPQTVVSF
jgi:hypothetical protein